MKTLDKEQLDKIIESHGRWVRNEAEGQRAYLRGADLRGAYLQGIDLRGAYLQRAYLQRADLQGADLRGAYLQGADLQGAYLQGADLRGAYLQGIDLRGAYLQGADLQGADLQGAYLQGIDLRGAKGLPDITKQFDFLKQLERTSSGYICYKTFGLNYTPPDKWKIEKNSIIEEFTDFNQLSNCSYGINVGTLEWVKEHTDGQIWKCLIKFDWLIGTVIPVYTDGKFRTSRLLLLDKIER
jgi:hypothetical protein